MKEKIAIAILVLFAAIALLAPFIAPDPGLHPDLSKRFNKPSAESLFGRDHNGVDVLSEIMLGARTTLSISLATVAIGVFIGLLIGSAAGFNGGFTDTVVSRAIDMVQAFPGFLLALSLVAVLGPSTMNLLLALCLTSWAGYARLVRAEVIHLKTRDYVTASIACGAAPTRLLSRHIWPGVASILAVQATYGISGVILAESGLSFLGLGVSSSTPSWGTLMNHGRLNMLEAPHVNLFTGLAIVTLVASVQILGESLRRKLSPRESD
jgi:peptide/nickel transport system permease protein